MKIKVFAVELLAASMIITACSSASVPSVTTTVPETTAVVTTETTVPPTSTPTPTPVVYDFTWTPQDSENFANYVKDTVGKPLFGYIMYFGFTDELNAILTNYINAKNNTDYDSVPFSKVSYFHTFMVDTEVGYQTCRNSSETFFYVCLDTSKAHHGPFVNKLIMSYFYQNKIPLGSRIPFDNMKALGVEDLYSYDGVDNILNNGWWDLGNYDSSYEYSNIELLTALEAYNAQLRRLCNDERIQNLDILTDDPEFPQAAEAREIYNGFLKDFYGFDNCPQFGELVTREQYIEIFGEEPLDLSYIPGAIFDPALVPDKTSSTANASDSGSKTDERLIGEWTTPENYSGYTGTYIFNEDNTGTYIYTAQTMDLETGELSEKTTVTEFRYSVEYGMLVLEYDNGNTYSFNYKIENEGITINGMYFEQA